MRGFKNFKGSDASGPSMYSYSMVAMTVAMLTVLYIVAMTVAMLEMSLPFSF